MANFLRELPFITLAALFALALVARPQGLRHELHELHELVAGDGNDDQQFGWVVALSGDTAVVGAKGDDESATNAGAAYVYQRDRGGPGRWGLVKKLMACDGSMGDEFGFSAAIDGDVIVVGARFEDETANDAGAAYVFERNLGGPDNWGERKKLLGSTGVAFDWMGWAVEVAGDTIMVGAIGGAIPGWVYVYERDLGGTDNWGELDRLAASDGVPDDRFGRSISIWGDTVVITADGDDDDGSSSGSAYVLERDLGGVDNWGERRKIKASDGFAVDHFGISASLYEDTVVIGAHQANAPAMDSGAAYVFERDLGEPNLWGERKKITPIDGAESDIFGRTVSLVGDVVLIGAQRDDDGGTDTGSAYLFGRDEDGVNAWGELTKVTASDPGDMDFFGWSLALGPRVALITAIFDDSQASDAGSTYVFGFPGARSTGGVELTPTPLEPAGTGDPPAPGSLRASPEVRLGEDWHLVVERPLSGGPGLVLIQDAASGRVVERLHLLPSAGRLELRLRVPDDPGLLGRRLEAQALFATGGVATPSNTVETLLSR